METSKLEQSVTRPAFVFGPYFVSLIALCGFVITSVLYLEERFLKPNWEDLSERWKGLYYDSDRRNDRLLLERSRLETEIGDLQSRIDELTERLYSPDRLDDVAFEAHGWIRPQTVFHACMATMSDLGPIRDLSTSYLDYAIWNCQRATEWYVSHPFDAYNPFFPFAPFYR